MAYQSPTAFPEFVLFQRTLQLLDRYGIKPMGVNVELYLTDDLEHYRWILNAHAGTSSEQIDRLTRLHADLGIQEVNGMIEVQSFSELDQKLCDALEKAPKSFTRRR